MTLDQEFKVNYTPAEINFKDYDALKAKVEETIEGWSDYVVTAESYSSDKKTKAELNRMRKALNDRRKEITKQASEPIDKFTEQIKYLDKEIKVAVDRINDGIKFFDEKAKKERHQQNLLQLGEIAKEYGVDLQELEYDPKWDNKTASWKSIEEDARKQFEDILEKEKAKKEAQQVIIDKANSYTKPAMTASSYLDLLNYKSLPDILKQMDNDHEYLRAQAQRQAEQKRKEIQSIEKKGDKYINAETGEVAKEVYTIILKVTGNKDQLKALSSFMKDWGIVVESIN